MQEHNLKEKTLSHSRHWQPQPLSRAGRLDVNIFTAAGGNVLVDKEFSMVFIYFQNSNGFSNKSCSLPKTQLNMFCSPKQRAADPDDVMQQRNRELHNGKEQIKNRDNQQLLRM